VAKRIPEFPAVGDQPKKATMEYSKIVRLEKHGIHEEPTYFRLLS
jgi:hypothetical protein